MHLQKETGKWMSYVFRSPKVQKQVQGIHVNKGGKKNG